MPGLSLSMIVRDEELTIGRVLADISSICDEIIVVDTGSTDATVEIAKEHGAEVHHFEWICDFAAARNFSLSKCHGDWILWLDADDRVTPPARDAFRTLYEEVKARTDIDAVVLPYRWEASELNPDSWNITLQRERLLRNSPRLTWSNPIHENVNVDANRIIRQDFPVVEHRPLPELLQRKQGRNLAILETVFHAGDRSSRILKYLAREYILLERYDEAIELLDEALQDDDVEEKYHILCTYAEVAGKIGGTERRLQLLLQATIFDSRRAEAFVMIGEHFLKQQEWARAMPFFRAATALHRPVDVHDGSSFDPAYTYLPWDHMSVCAYHLGKYEHAIEYAIKAMPGNPERERLYKNLEYNIQELERKRP